MKGATDSQFSILPDGGLKEELLDRSDIETMCRAGRLSPNSLVFLPDENTWKKLVDTDFSGCFEKRDPVGSQTRTSPEVSGRKEEYASLVEQLRVNPGDLALSLTAAEIALAMGETDSACEHYQRALEISPYHPRVVQEVKRTLPSSKWRSLRFLEKPPQVWEEPARIFVYPCSRGPLYLAVPAAVLTGLLWTVWTALPAFLVLSLWGMEVLRSASRGDTRPPLWHGLASDPVRRIARPLAVTVTVAIELCVLFLALSGVLVLTKLSDETNVFLVIAKSPLLLVLLWTVGLTYFPAVIMLTAASAMGIRDIVNPRTIVSAIRVMEGEYVISVFFVALLVFVAWGVASLIDFVPVLWRVFHAGATVYILLAGGFVFGRVYARFGERMDGQTRDDGSRAE